MYNLIIMMTDFNVLCVHVYHAVDWPMVSFTTGLNPIDGFPGILLQVVNWQMPPLL